MSIFDNWFNHKNTVKPNLNFGRYTDTNKSSAQYNCWEQSLLSFEAEDFIKSLDYFFQYLKDERSDNVFWQRNGASIDFYFYQGSRKITGHVRNNYFRAEAFVAKSSSLNVGLLRRLVEKNFNLNYSRFALSSENIIAIVFTSSIFDASPYKIFYALKEIATSADKLDDILLDEFDSLSPIEEGRKLVIDDNVKAIKYNFLITKINEVLYDIENSSLNADQYPGAISYQLLDLCYKFDYLIVPEGFMMDCLERIHRIYFSNQDSNISVIDKNNQIIIEYKNLLSRDEQQYFKEFYDVISTFGVSSPFSQEQINSFIDGELKNVTWYKDNQYSNITVAICGYIVGFLVFNYALPKPIASLFHLYYMITNNKYFNELGYKQELYNMSTNTYNQKNIKNLIDDIISKNKSEYKFLTSNYSLNFSSEAEFCYSYLIMVRNQDVRK